MLLFVIYKRVILANACISEIYQRVSFYGPKVHGASVYPLP
jgi:hypothetical protein